MGKIYDAVQDRAFHDLDKDPARSFTLPGFYYSRPDIFAEECERIFYKSWQLVAHESELANPGDYACAEIVDQGIFVIRGKDGTVRGFYNVCQHRAHELLKGRGSIKGAIVCPYHAWAYETDGSLRAARHADKLPDFDKGCFSLKEVRVEIALGFVFVNLDPAAPTLDSLAGAMFEDMRSELPWWDEVKVSAESSGDSWDGSVLKANWKTLAENCLECYHCAPAHPALCDLVDMRSYHCAVNGAWLKSFGKLNKPENRAYAVDPSEPSQVAVFWHLWPNVEFGVLPGEASIGAFRFYPRAPEGNLHDRRDPDPAGRGDSTGAPQLSLERALAGRRSAVRVGQSRPEVAWLQPGTLHRRSRARRHQRACGACLSGALHRDDGTLIVQLFCPKRLLFPADTARKQLKLIFTPRDMVLKHRRHTCRAWSDAGLAERRLRPRQGSVTCRVSRSRDPGFPTWKADRGRPSSCCTARPVRARNGAP